MKKRVYALFLALFATVEGQAATIDRMTTSWADDYHSSSQSLAVIGLPDTYYLNDGSSWQSGAGSFYLASTSLSSISLDGDMISYHLNNPPDNILMDYTDYNGGDHSSQGVLGVSSPLIITAQMGSSTARLAGYTEVISNDETWYGEPRFNYYSAEVGDVVNFEVEYRLSGGAVFDQNIFDTEFFYTLDGFVDFTSVVPIPPALYLFTTGLLGLVRMARRKAA